MASVLRRRENLDRDLQEGECHVFMGERKYPSPAEGKKNDKPVSLENTDTNILNKISAHKT